MGMTMTQKILASKAGMNEVRAGQFIEANIEKIKMLREKHPHLNLSEDESYFRKQLL